MTPVVACEPLQPSEAVQLVALVELQLSTELEVETIELGDAEMVTVGNAGVTVTVTVCVALPLAFVQVKL